VKSDLFDIVVKIKGETDLAVKVTDETGEPVWLPKSQIEIERRPDGYAEITMPEWLAIDKGFA
jgi:hypothetical protein